MRSSILQHGQNIQEAVEDAKEKNEGMGEGCGPSWGFGIDRSQIESLATEVS